jgi:hypothetical protein
VAGDREGPQGSSSMTNRRNLPAPQVQAFVVCREVWHDPRTNEFVITGPVSHVPIPTFPADIRLSVYAHVTGGHGTYPMLFELRAADGDTVWQWTPADPLVHTDPLKPQQLAFHELLVRVDAPGRYDLVLVDGAHEIARQPLLIGPAEVFRDDAG